MDTILIVDDEIDLIHGLERTIAMEIDCRILMADNGAKAMETLHNEPVDVLLADIRMPVVDGISLLKAAKEISPAISVIIMTAYGTIARAVEAIKAGAFDFIQKPLDEERLFHLLRKGLELNRLVRENARLTAKVREKEPFEHIVGNSKPMLALYSKIKMLGKSDVNVLILGETGTGKEMAATAIHRLSGRSHREIITVNCPALPETILESELFGYKKGAFTNADTDKKGYFDHAHLSTIFLDEIGDLNLSLQTKLLRVLQDKRITPLGDTRSHPVDVRIIAATNQLLQQKIESGQFRQDLFYRLNVATLTIPRLEEIRADIPLLATHFMKKIALEQNTDTKKLSPGVMNCLLKRKWPGNIRELENTLRGWCALTPSQTIHQKHIQPDEAVIPCLADNDGITRPYKELKNEVIDRFTIDYLHGLLAHTGGNVSLAAHISGIKRQSLQKIIRRYQVDVSRYRP